MGPQHHPRGRFTAHHVVWTPRSSRLRSSALTRPPGTCGVAPLPASSGRTDRHRLNRGGDRAANCALYRIVLCRLRHDPATQAYAERRTKQGLSKPEIIRCLKRYVAREVYHTLVPRPTIDLSPAA
jgi:transposase